jgi:hypothetical protein
MARDQSLVGTNGAAPTETTPLLNDQLKVPDVSVTAVNGESSGDERQNVEEADSREGLPEVAARMHLILPAIGIGVSLLLSFFFECGYSFELLASVSTVLSRPVRYLMHRACIFRTAEYTNQFVHDSTLLFHVAGLRCNHNKSVSLTTF